jgi:hypothetical protein
MAGSPAGAAPATVLSAAADAPPAVGGASSAGPVVSADVGADAVEPAFPAPGPIVGSGPTAALPGTGFADTFGAAVDNDPGYGLNDSLTRRQSGAVGVTYTRESGLWYQAPAPQPWYSQVNHVNHPGTLSFWRGTSAVRMDAPLIVGSNGVVGVQAIVDPVTGDLTSSDWSSLVLSNSGDSGYVANPDVAIGVLVRSSGGIQVFQDGTPVMSQAGFAQPDSGGKFNVIVSYIPGQRSAQIYVNGSTATVTTPAALPASSTLFMGAYLSHSSEVSTLNDLNASAVNLSGLALPSSSGLRYYGYYAARLTGDSHLAEVAGRSNLNWVNISDVDGYVPDVLNGCASDACVVNTGNEFFSCTSSGNNCGLYPNYEARWNNLATTVKPYLDKIAAFYILDEPQWHGATPAEIETSAELIRSTFPGKKVMMIEAGPKITSSLTIPSSVDWVGFDWYCQPFSTIQQKLSTLESLTARSGQGLFLVPEDAPLSACSGVTGHKTDSDIAALQWDYFDLAEQNPRVIGLMNFGFWTAPAWTSGNGASSLPLTVNANERVAARLLARADQ